MIETDTTTEPAGELTDITQYPENLPIPAEICNGDNDGSLSGGDEMLLAALLNGSTVQMAASISRMSERTVYRRLADPVFRQRLESARESVRESILARLTDAAGAAVDTLWHLTDDLEPAIRLQAAKALLDSLAKFSAAQPKRATMVKYSVEQTREG